MCVMIVSLGCFNCSTFVVIDREFASGLYNKIVQLIEGKQTDCVLPCQKFVSILCTLECQYCNC